MVDHYTLLPTAKVDGIPGSTVTVFEYVLPPGTEMLFTPWDPNLYMEGVLADAAGVRVDDYSCVLIAQPSLGPDPTRTLWDGVTTAINDGATMRQSGHPLCYNGGAEVVLGGGDRLLLQVETPPGGRVIVGAMSNLTLMAYRLPQTGTGKLMR